MKKYKIGQVLKSIEPAVPVYDMEISTTIDYLNLRDKVIVLEYITRHTGSNYIKILFGGNRVGFVFNYKDRWEEIN